MSTGFVEFRELCRHAQNKGCDFVFYDKFLELCKKKGVKPTPAATDAGISKSLVTKWKTEKIEVPSAEVLTKLSKYFNVPVSELLGEELEKENSPSELSLSEREVRLIELFRLIPEDRQEYFLELGRLYADSLRKG